MHSFTVWILLQDDKHWTQYFTQKINDVVKLVAPTISCQPASPLPPESNDNKLMPPYAQLSVLATDQVGVPPLRNLQSALESSNNRACFAALHADLRTQAEASFVDPSVGCREESLLSISTGCTCPFM